VTKLASLNRPILSAAFKGGQLYGVGPSGDVLRVNHTTGTTKIVTSELDGGPRDLALLADGRLLTCEENEHRFVAVDVESGAVDVITGGSRLPEGEGVGAPPCEHGVGFGTDAEGNVFAVLEGTLFKLGADLLDVS